MRDCSNYTLKLFYAKSINYLFAVYFNTFYSNYYYTASNYGWKVNDELESAQNGPVYTGTSFCFWISYRYFFSLESRGSSVSIVSGYGLGDRGSIPGRGEGILPLDSVSRPALGPAHAPVQWVQGVLYPGVKRGVSRSWMSRSYLSSAQIASMACSWTALLFVLLLLSENRYRYDIALEKQGIEKITSCTLLTVKVDRCYTGWATKK
jgi:hypothetical protein